MTAGARPLTGVRVAVTRPLDSAAALEELLRSAGAVPVTVPLTRVLPPENDASLRRAVMDIDRIDWIVFTSVRAVRAVADVRGWQGARPRIAAVGPATAAAVRGLTGADPDIVPRRKSASDIVPAMLDIAPLQDATVLWPRAEEPRPELRRALDRAGARVEDPVAYRTVADPVAGARLAGIAADGGVDVITFTAPSAVDCFADACHRPIRCVIGVIGPVTASAARGQGLPVHVEAEQPMISALVGALARHHDRGSAQL
ncbi:MAG TPA: uroporphyrinogen-III synthase [Longimicrobiales bacterium]|nr:uroporphyrinogen-III synthase [Longimicrobiales bacterium]